LVTNHRLYQTVDLEAVEVPAGQGVADQCSDGVGEGIGVGSGRAQRLVEDPRVVADQ
jgi:hypothetical protein